MPPTPCYGRAELRFPSECGAEVVTFTAPDGSTCRRPLFRHQPGRFTYDEHGYERLAADGSPIVIARFTPDQVGTWRWRAGTAAGEIDCVPSDHPGFIGIGRRDPRYFATSDGAPWPAIGVNLCRPVAYALPNGVEFGTADGQGTMGLAEYRRWFRRLQANGANCVRLWLSSPYFAVYGEVAGEVDLLACNRLDGVVELARTHGIRLKLCLEHFRDVREGGTPPVFQRRLRDADGRSPVDMRSWFSEAHWQGLWWRTIEALIARHGDDPVIWAWELWNEIDCCRTGDVAVQFAWTREALARLKRLAPRNLVVNSLGSFDHESKQALQDAFTMPEMDFQQVHRYLDQGASLAVVREDPAEATADAVRRSRRPDRPVLLAETGAVNDCHTGPFRFYRWDDDGLIFHDTTYPALFAGAAGCGHQWFWDRYVDEKGLWPMLKPLADLLDGVRLEDEGFRSLDWSLPAARVLVLAGASTDLLWIRNRADTWQAALRDQMPTMPVPGFDLLLPVPRCRAEVFRPWPNDAAGKVVLRDDHLIVPTFTHGLLVRLS